MQNRSGCNIAAFIVGAMPCAFFKRGCKGTFFFTYLQIFVRFNYPKRTLLQHFVNNTFYFGSLLSVIIACSVFCNSPPLTPSLCAVMSLSLPMLLGEQGSISAICL